MRKTLYLVSPLLFGLMAGCNGFTHPLPPDAPFTGAKPVFSGLPTPTLFMGTATQWNEEYAVTAAHTPNIGNIVHRCSTGCDLVFIKQRARGIVPTWRNPVPGEMVTAVGYSGLTLLPVKGTGTARSTRVILEDRKANVAYATHDAPLTLGMSGGPLYGADNAVLGINLGINVRYTWIADLHDPNSIGHARRNSYYLSTDIIQAEWELYQRSLAQNQLAQAQ